MWNNSVILAGYLVRKPEVKTVTITGETEKRNVCNFVIGVNTGHDEGSFFKCAAWGRTADYVAKYGEKGSLISLEGELKAHSYQKDDIQVTSYDIQVKTCHVAAVSTRGKTNVNEHGE